MMITEPDETASPQSAGGDGLPVVLRRLGDGQPGHEIAVERIWATCFMMKGFHKVVEGEELQIAVRDGENVSARVIWVSDRLVACRLGTANPSDDWFDASIARALAADADNGIETEESFGERFLRLRRAQHMTQAQLAERLGVSVPAICAWEKNKSRPKGARLAILSTIFGVAVTDLLGQSHASLHQEIDEARSRIARAAGINGAKVKIIIEM